MSETLSRPKCVQTPAPAVVVEDQIDRVLEQSAAPVQPLVDLPAFATPTQVGRQLALLQTKLEELEKNKRLCSPLYDRFYEEREAFLGLIFTMKPENLHDATAVLCATIDPLTMLGDHELDPENVAKYTLQVQRGVYNTIRFLCGLGIEADALAPMDVLPELERILGTPAEATPSALRDLADTMERQCHEVLNFPKDQWPANHGPQVFTDYWTNVEVTQTQTIQSAEDVVNLARIARTLEDSVGEGECPDKDNIHAMLVSAILDGHLPSPAGRDASIIAKAKAATAFGRHVDDVADRLPSDDAGDAAIARLVNRREDMLDDLVRYKPSSLQGFAAVAQAIVESDPGVKEGGEPISDSRHLAAFGRHLAAAAPQSGVSPDSALINDCNRFCAIEALYNRRVEAAHTADEDKAAEAENAPLDAERVALMKRIAVREARTPAGNAARARALSLFAPDLLEHSDGRDFAENMMAALARDTLAMGASA